MTTKEFNEALSNMTLKLRSDEYFTDDELIINNEIFCIEFSIRDDGERVDNPADYEPEIRLFDIIIQMYDEEADDWYDFDWNDETVEILKLIIQF